MAKKTVDALVEAGKATAGPPLGPALGPMGVNIGQVISEINKKTAEFKGMQVPVKVIIDESDKSFEIKIGTPPTTSLLKKEVNVKKGSGNPKEHVADAVIEQIIKVAKMKEDALLGATLKEKVKEVIGTCNSMGIMVEGVHAADAITLVNEGKFDKEIAEEKTEISAEEKAKLEEEKKKMEQELKEKREQFVKEANSIIKGLEGKESKEIRNALKEANIPQPIIDELAPTTEEKPAAEAKPDPAKK